MKVIRIIIAGLARFFLSLVFLAGAGKNLLNWHETEVLLMNTFSDWQAHLGLWDEAQALFTFLMPWAPLWLAIAVLFQLLGGLLVLLGIKEKLGATLLLLFLLPATILFHPFWFFEGAARELQSVMFLKNFAILGGIFLLLLHGGSSRSAGGGFSSFNIG